MLGMCLTRGLHAQKYDIHVQAAEAREIDKYVRTQYHWRWKVHDRSTMVCWIQCLNPVVKKSLTDLYINWNSVSNSVAFIICMTSWIKAHHASFWGNHASERGDLVDVQQTTQDEEKEQQLGDGGPANLGWRGIQLRMKPKHLTAHS